MSEGALPVATPAAAVNAGPGMKVEYQPVKPGNSLPAAVCSLYLQRINWMTPQSITASGPFPEGQAVS